MNLASLHSNKIASEVRQMTSTASELHIILVICTAKFCKYVYSITHQSVYTMLTVVQKYGRICTLLESSLRA
jgi:hypothetical protein